MMFIGQASAANQDDLRADDIAISCVYTSVPGVSSRFDLLNSMEYGLRRARHLRSGVCQT